MAEKETPAYEQLTIDVIQGQPPDGESFNLVTFSGRVAASADGREPPEDSLSEAHNDLGGNSTHQLSEDELVKLAEVGLGGRKALAALYRRQTKLFYESIYGGYDGPLSDEKKQVYADGLRRVRLSMALTTYTDIVEKCRRPDGSVDTSRVMAVMRARSEKQQ